VQFVFTANPEDYTNRGSIITPLKDRIQSQIMTHYPASIELAKQITRSEAKVSEEAGINIEVSELIRNLIEQVSFVARESEFVDQKSGVSARLGVSALECLVASAEQRMLKSVDTKTKARISDLLSIIPAITGKVELVYEGEQEGAVQVAHNLIRQAIRKEFLNHYPSPEKLTSKQNGSPYTPIVEWFSRNEFDISHWLSNDDYKKTLIKIKPISGFIETFNPDLPLEHRTLHSEFVLHALAEFSLISKKGFQGSFNFNDMLNSMLG
jgi:magnesium chelatase subunit I